MSKFLAAANGNIYDITTAASPTSLASGFTSNKWQTVNFLSRTFFANGADTMQVFNGSTIAASTFTGVTLSTLVGGWQYQQRLYFWANNSTGFWYAPLNSITGALQFYDLAPFAPNGGNIVTMTNFTHDGSNGVNDFAVFMLSSGDALVYFGNDPGLASEWQLVGRFRLAPPISVRAMTTYGGDGFITTYADHTSMHDILTALMEGRLPPRSKASGAVQAATSANPNGFGWQALYYPKGHFLLFNIPNANGTFDQHIWNTSQSDKPWCRFTGMASECWGLFENNLYFGSSNGIVYQADTGTLDNMGAIQAVAQQAWNKMDSPQRKRVTACRPVLQTSGSMSYTFALGFDFAALNIPVPVVTSAVGSLWNVSLWNTSPWSTEDYVNVQWRIGGGSGTSVGWGINLAATKGATWFRTDLRMEGGNAL